MIYFDNAATTKVDNEVIDAMIPFFNQFYANPSSQHKCGKIAFDALDLLYSTQNQTTNSC